MRIKTSNIIIIILLILNSILIYNCNKKAPNEIINTDTVYITNTITTYIPKYFIKEVKIKEIDTIIYTNTDTIKVSIPITQKVYKDSLYTAYISGYKQSLDSLNIINQTQKIIEYKTIKERDNGFFFTPYIGAGYGIFHKQIDLQIGFGAGYKF